MNYMLQSEKAGNGTFYLSHLLDSKEMEFLDVITPEILAGRFGDRIDVYHDPEKGYENGEWYWQEKCPDWPDCRQCGECGAIWGIGFRWGEARLRGTIENGEAAKKFIEYIKIKLGHSMK